MFTADEKNLEKFIDVHISIPPLDGERWENFFNQIIKNIFSSHREIIEEEQIELLNYAFDEIKFYIKPLLVTPRLIKTFGRHLEEKLQSPANTVNIIDMVCLTVIRHYGLPGQFVGNNKIYFIVETPVIQTITKKSVIAWVRLI